MPSIINTSRIAVVGLGQLGGSLALRLRQVGCVDLFGVARREATLRLALDRGMIDAGSTTGEEVLPVVDVAFLCLPLTATIAYVRANLKHFRPGSLVTDVGSVKGSIQRELRALLLQHGVYFIGSHPMAGSEKEGLEASRADLYTGATVFLTPTEADDEDAIHLLAEIWRDLGAVPLELSAARHDAAVAYSSHMPHLLATALVRTVLGQGDAEAQRTACAGGFRDMSRIAASNVAMWTDIAEHNRDAILAAMDRLQAELAATRALVASHDWEGLRQVLANGRELREAWFTEYSQARQPKAPASDNAPATEPPPEPSALPPRRDE